MQFKVSENIIWEAQTWRITYVDENIVVLRPKESKESVIKTLAELERAYLAGDLISEGALTPKTIAEEQILLSDLSIHQQRKINMRMQFIQCLLREDVTVDNAQDEINKLADRLEIPQKNVPGVSSVRRWLTTYRKSDCQTISLMDKRSSICKG